MEAQTDATVDADALDAGADAMAAVKRCEESETRVPRRCEDAAIVVEAERAGAKRTEGVRVCRAAAEDDEGSDASPLFWPSTLALQSKVDWDLGDEGSGGGRFRGCDGGCSSTASILATACLGIGGEACDGSARSGATSSTGTRLPCVLCSRIRTYGDPCTGDDGLAAVLTG